MRIWHSLEESSEGNQVFAVGALAEVIGWAGRTWSSACPYNNNAFLMQISTLIIGKPAPQINILQHHRTNALFWPAPTFFTAGTYIILGQLIRLKGPHTSPISPALYLWIFCTCDVVSLVVQAIGGGLASNAAGSPSGNTKPGTDIMVAGILFQMLSVATFTALGASFLIRVRIHKGTFEPSLRWLVAAKSGCVLSVFISRVYRSVELLQGWTGYLITHEGYFIALDGALMVLAVGVFNFAHPGWLLGKVSHHVRDGRAQS